MSFIFSFSGENIEHYLKEDNIIQGNVSGYSSSEDETDSSPTITASGQITRKGIVANNCLKFGTMIKIGNEFYQVQDRMNKRFDCEHFDIWFNSKKEALEWGRKIIKVKVL